ncbi:MAG: hypothetical protein ABS897_06355, partial [Eubacteriales bacterium]
FAWLFQGGDWLFPAFLFKGVVVRMWIVITISNMIILKGKSIFDRIMMDDKNREERHLTLMESITDRCGGQDGTEKQTGT